MHALRFVVVTASLWVALGCLGCSEPPRGELVVEVRTALVPGLEFNAVETVLLRTDVPSTGATGSRASSHLRSENAQARFGHDFRTGRRVADLEGVEPGSYSVRVSLIRPDGRSVLVTRTVAISMQASVRVVRVVLDRSCVGLECPLPGGSAALEACLGGRCVDPRCEPPNPEFCGELFCNDASDCPTGPACSEPVCLEGVCDLAPIASGAGACPSGTWCSVEAGACLPVGEGTADAGVDGSVLCGTVCPGRGGPCEVGYWDCSTGSPVCTSFLLLPVGTDCGAGRVCDEAGECVTCAEGVPCREGCRDGTIACTSGAMTCMATSAAPEDASCSPDEVLLTGLDDPESPFACSASGACERRESLVLEPTPVELREGTSITVTLRASVPVRGELTITLSTTDGPRFADGSRLGSTSIPLRITDGETTTFDMFAISDEMVNEPRPFTLSFSAAVSADPRFDGLVPADVDGVLYDLCAPDRGDCNGDFTDGCEADFKTNETCGRCDLQCLGALMSGAELCDGSACVLRCDMGAASCNGVVDDGCEVMLGTPGHCTACGDTCPFPHATGVCGAAGACAIGTCDMGYSDCNTYAADGCELMPGGSCTPVGQLCNAGTLACNAGRGRPVCTAGARLPAGSTCGVGGTCDASGNCLCARGVAANTPCGVDSVCSGGAPNLCVRNAFWENPGCAATPTGDSLCMGRGFARAVSAYGYSWSECGGPNAALAAGVDNCLELDATRSRCVRWTPGTACNGVSLGTTRFGVTLTEYGGPHDHTFRITDFWGRGCAGWNPGYSIRTVCEY